MSTEYAIYLRKSRADLEAEASGAGDTLARHEHILMDLAKSRALPIGAIYREVVSGERIANRPYMQQLLAEVEEGRWKGVLVTETSRLARGDTIDQGIVAQAFKFSGTLIVTPSKTYDLTQETDEEWTEFSLFMARQEYRMIRRRMNAGRKAAKREGKYIGNRAPYGYERIKLKGRGWSLRPVPERAKVIRMIFDLYLSGLGYCEIEKRLNALHIPAPKGEAWSSATIPCILKNAHYIGCIPSAWRPSKKVVKDGVVINTRPRNNNPELYEGLHEAIIDRDTWERAQARLKANASLRTPGDRKPANPLAGLLICDCCGKRMQRRPQTNPNIKTEIICTTRGCATVAHNADELEQLVLESLRVFLAQVEAGAPQALDLTTEQTALADLDNKLNALDARLRRTFELVEDGTYDRETFLARQSELNKERAELIVARSEIQHIIDERKKEYAAQSDLAPKIRYVLDTYSTELPVTNRNRLLKQVIDHVDYHKRTRLRWEADNDLSLTLHPVVFSSTSHR